MMKTLHQCKIYNPHMLYIYAEYVNAIQHTSKRMEQTCRSGTDSSAMCTVLILPCALPFLKVGRPVKHRNPWIVWH